MYSRVSVTASLMIGGRDSTGNGGEAFFWGSTGSGSASQLPANSAKTATFEKKCSQISHFSRVLHDENKEELQFLRDERAAIREFDGGMSKSRAEYLSVLDVPCLPNNSNNHT